MTFGPWVAELEPAERLARLRALRALAGVFCHRFPKFAEALRAAETDKAALAEALRLLDTLPAINRRRLLASYLPVIKTAAPQVQLATDRRGTNA
jgi:hypothetical protein